MGRRCLDAILGALLCGGLLWAAAILYKLVRGRDGMGFGDVKMMFMVGTFLGVRGAFLTIMVGTLLGTVIGLGVIFLLFVSGWKSALARRASKMGLGKVGTLRCAIASRYQLRSVRFSESLHSSSCFLVPGQIPLVPASAWIGTRNAGTLLSLVVPHQQSGFPYHGSSSG